MGKLGKKARKFAKKNLQSVEKRNRKLKPFFKKKFAKSKFFFVSTSLIVDSFIIMESSYFFSF